MPPRDHLIEHLHRRQDQRGGLWPSDLKELAAEFRLSEAELFETASFYAHFRLMKDGEPAPKAVIRACNGPACAMRGADALRQVLSQELGAGVAVEEAPCIGLCDHAPAVLANGQPVRAATLEAVALTLEAGPGRRPVADHDFEALNRCLSGALDRAAVLAALEESGLRGMGGAGFPVARKWRTVAAQPAPRLVAVNADEGEPGTFKDRFFLETDPCRVLAGAQIAAWAVEADAVYVYLRDEYSDLIPKLEAAIALLPAGSVPVHLRRGAGAYVCGEESALIESLEGKRGLPRQRPPYVAESGLFGRPTLVNNVETLHWVTVILDGGPEAWKAQGDPGLRAYSVSGRVREPGVKIAPNGIKIDALIDQYCGGMEEGHHLVAYLPGGASGGFLPAHIRPPLTFGAIEEHGGFIGSAAVVVFSQADDLVEAARDLARFFAHESCGQCSPCRLGAARAAEAMEAEVWDRVLLDDLAYVMRQASICGLGQAAPNVWQSLLRHFPEFAP